MFAEVLAERGWPDAIGMMAICATIVLICWIACRDD